MKQAIAACRAASLDPTNLEEVEEAQKEGEWSYDQKRGLRMIKMYYASKSDHEVGVGVYPIVLSCGL